MTRRAPNVGWTDRIARGVLTPILLGAVGWLYYSVPHESLTLAVMGGLVVIAFILAASALTGTCGIYAALGIDTCKCEEEYAGGNTWG